MPSWHNIQIHLSMPLGTYGILFTRTWVLIQPIDLIPSKTLGANDQQPK
jgi:hypothetical protein